MHLVFLLSNLKTYIMKNIFTILILTCCLVSCQKNQDAIPTTVETVTPQSLSALASSGTWRITYSYNTNRDETANYTGYIFTFAGNNKLTAVHGGNMIVGNWSVGADDAKAKMQISFPIPASFAKLSHDWVVLDRLDKRLKLQNINTTNGNAHNLILEKN